MKLGKILLLKIFIFSILFFIGRYVVTQNLLDYSLWTLDMIDYSGGFDSIRFIDDTTKYEVSILNGRDLSWYHAGELFNIAHLIPRILSRGNPYIYIFLVISLQLYLVFEIYSVFKYRNHLLDFLLIPIFVYYSVTINKEIYTIFSLLFFSKQFLNKVFFDLNNNDILQNLILYIRLIILGNFVAASIIGRPYLFFLVISINIFINFFRNILSGKFINLKITAKNIFQITLISFFIFAIFIKNMEYIDFQEILSGYEINTPAENKYAATAYLRYPYSLVAPFPLAFLKLPSLTEGISVYNFHVLWSYSLAFVSILRVSQAYKFLIKSKVNLINKFFNNSYLFSILFTILIIVGLFETNFTRQIITLLIPCSLLLNDAVQAENRLRKVNN